MNKAELRAPWEFSKAVFSLSPVAGNGAQNGASIDRTGYASLIADIVYSVSGSPTGGAISAKLQDSADGVTFTDFGTAVSLPITSGNAAGAVGSLALDIAGARRYVRVVTQAAPTGGSSPAASTAHSVRLFGPDRLPAL
jgi:hypothetical protein